MTISIFQAIGILAGIGVIINACQNTSSQAQTPNLPQLEIHKRFDDAIIILSRDSRPLEVREILVNRRCKTPINGFTKSWDEALAPMVINYAKSIITGHGATQCADDPILEITVTTDKGKLTVQY